MEDGGSNCLGGVVEHWNTLSYVGMQVTEETRYVHVHAAGCLVLLF